MNTLIPAVLALLFLFNPLYSQSQKTEQFKNPLKPGAVAVQFELGTFINPAYFQAVSISVKPMLSKTSGFRLGVSLNLKNSDGTSGNGFTANPSNDKNTNIAASLNYLFHFGSTERVKFFAGLGPLYEYRETKEEYNYVSSYPPTYSYSTYGSSKEWYTGGIAVLGAEWFVHERISIMAEYNLAFKTGKYNSTTTQKETTPYNPNVSYIVRTEAYDRTALEFDIVKIGLSVYF